MQMMITGKSTRWDLSRNVQVKQISRNVANSIKLVRIDELFIECNRAPHDGSALPHFRKRMLLPLLSRWIVMQISPRKIFILFFFTIFEIHLEVKKKYRNCGIGFSRCLPFVFCFRWQASVFRQSLYISGGAFPSGICVENWSIMRMRRPRHSAPPSASGMEARRGSCRVLWDTAPGSSKENIIITDFYYNYIVLKGGWHEQIYRFSFRLECWTLWEFSFQLDPIDCRPIELPLNQKTCTSFIQRCNEFIWQVEAS